MRTAKMKIVFIAVVLAAIAGCELFQAPARDNPNDPEYSGSLPIPGAVEGLLLAPGVDYIGVSWTAGTPSGADKYIVYWDTADSITEETQRTEIVTQPYTISGLTYGSRYNVWVRAVDTVDGQDIYAKDDSLVTASAVPEPKGLPDTAFSGDGLLSLTANDTKITDFVYAGSDQFFSGADQYAAPGPPAQYNAVVSKLNMDGTAVTGFAASGIYISNSTDEIGSLSMTFNNSLTVFKVPTSPIDSMEYLSFVNDFTNPVFSNTATTIAVKKAISTSTGDIIVCGSFYDDPSAKNHLLLRNLSLDLMGSDSQHQLDTSTILPGQQNSFATSMVILNNHLYVAGYADDGGGANLITILGSFNPDSLSYEEVYNLGTSWNNHGEKIILDAAPDGSLLIAGYMDLMRYDPVNKQKILSFGGDGFADGIDPLFIASAISIQSNGKILLAGTSNALNGVLYRFNADGTLDTGFGNQGKFIRENYKFHTVEIFPNGRIAIGGENLTGTHYGQIWLLN